MSEAPKTVTRKQARSQINHFGRSLIIYIITALIMYYGTGYFYQYFSGAQYGYSQNFLTLGASAILLVMVPVAAFGLSSFALKLNIRDYAKSSGVSFYRQMMLNCIGIVISLSLFTAVSVVGISSFSKEISYEYLGVFTSEEYILCNILYFILFVLLKPASEEYIFRGVIQRQLGHYGRYFGVLASAFLYAIAQADIAMAIPAFFTGWYLSHITLKYHSIRPSIMISSSIQLFYLVLQIIPGRFIWVTIVLIVLLFILAGLGIIHKELSFKLPKTGATEWPLWKMMLTCPTIIICILLFILNIAASVAGL